MYNATYYLIILAESSGNAIGHERLDGRHVCKWKNKTTINTTDSIISHVR